MPVLGLAARPVKRPLAHVVMVAVALSAIHTLNCKRRVYAIEVAYRERTSEESILQSVVVVSIVGPVVAPVAVGPVGNGRVVEFGVHNLLARCAVDYRHIIRRVALALLGVVYNTVGIGVGILASAHVASPRLGGLVPEARAVRALHNHLGAPVAIDVVGHHHVALAGVDVNVRAHVYRPEAAPVERICLQLVARGCGSGVGLPCQSAVSAVNEQRVKLAVAVVVHGPGILKLVIVGIEHRPLEIDVYEHIVVSMALKEEWGALVAFRPVGRNHGHSQLGTVGYG